MHWTKRYASVGREMKLDAPEAFRVIVESKYRTKIYGPYATLAAARGAATRETSPDYYRREALAHKIQRSSQVWEDVE